METIINTQLTAQELRIGNWLKFVGKISYSITRVQQLRPEHGCGASERYFVNTKPIDNYEPIPLTPEILNKTNLESDRGEWSLKRERFEGDHDKQNIDDPKYGYCDIVFLFNLNTLFVSVGIGNEYDTGIRVKYVHQLQNLYFTLTGEELQIDL